MGNLGSVFVFSERSCKGGISWVGAECYILEHVFMAFVYWHIGVVKV